MGPRLTKNAGEALRTAGALSTVGLSFVLALALGFWFGTVVDRRLGTQPVFAIVFFFFGLAAGILNVYRIVSQAYPPGARAPVPPPPAPPRDPTDRDLLNDDD